jgi:hypothetical protein
MSHGVAVRTHARGRWVRGWKGMDGRAEAGGFIGPEHARAWCTRASGTERKAARTLPTGEWIFRLTDRDTEYLYTEKPRPGWAAALYPGHGGAPGTGGGGLPHFIVVGCRASGGAPGTGGGRGGGDRGMGVVGVG